MPTLTAPARLLCLWNEADSVMQITTVRRRRAAFSSLIHLEVGSWFDYGLLAQTFMLAAKARGAMLFRGSAYGAGLNGHPDDDELTDFRFWHFSDVLRSLPMSAVGG